MCENVDDIYGLLKCNTISLDNASKKLFERIYLKPTSFGIFYMTEDDRSDYMLFLFDKLPRIIENYSEKMSTFTTYIITCVKNLKKTWYRRYYRKCAQNVSITQYCKHDYTLFVGEQDEEYTTEVNDYDICNNKDKFKLLVLGLKSCYFLTDLHISMLSKKTGICIDTICEYKHYLDATIEKKVTRYEKEKEKINKAFIQKNRCSYELSCINNDSSMGQHVLKSQKYYTRVWQRGIHDNACIKRLRPSNKEISKVLNVYEHTVYHALRDLKKESP